MLLELSRLLCLILYWNSLWLILQNLQTSSVCWSNKNIHHCRTFLRPCLVFLSYTSDVQTLFTPISVMSHSSGPGAIASESVLVCWWLLYSNFNFRAAFGIKCSLYPRFTLYVIVFLSLAIGQHLLYLLNLYCLLYNNDRWDWLVVVNLQRCFFFTDTLFCSTAWMFAVSVSFTSLRHFLPKGLNEALDYVNMWGKQFTTRQRWE